MDKETEKIVEAVASPSVENKDILDKLSVPAMLADRRCSGVVHKASPRTLGDPPNTHVPPKEQEHTAAEQITSSASLSSYMEPRPPLSERRVKISIIDGSDFLSAIPYEHSDLDGLKLPHEKDKMDWRERSHADLSLLYKRK